MEGRKRQELQDALPGGAEASQLQTDSERVAPGCLQGHELRGQMGLGKESFPQHLVRESSQTRLGFGDDIAAMLLCEQSPFGDTLAGTDSVERYLLAIASGSTQLYSAGRDDEHCSGCIALVL